MRETAGKRLRVLAGLIAILTLLVLAGGGWFYSRLRASLPPLDGTLPLRGLTAPVTVERDALGVPTIRGSDRRDVARALGYVHAQDRFFQMDLLRRRAAGELAELFGEKALPADKAVRVHGFRALARQVIAAAPPQERALVEAYTEGVNAGLAALGAKPFEYLVLRATPEPWRPEDCALIDYAMMLTLEDSSGRYEHDLDTLRNTYGNEALAFFAPLSTPNDAALDGSMAPLPAIPGPEAINLRRVAWEGPPLPAEDRPAVGSNSFAVSGDHTANGAALLANDMHLDLAVPNTWYRASLEWTEPSGPDPAKVIRVTGVTLPGSFVVVAGSNGHVAWGFTDSFADTGDLVAVNVSGMPGFYHVPGGDQRQIESRHDVIRVKGGKDVGIDYDWTIWGPIVGAGSDGRPLAYHWIAHDPAAVNFGLIGLERAATVDDAIAVAHRAGVPTLNFLAADSAGRIAWTIAGRLPERKGFDGRLPVSWLYGDRGWTGLLPANEVPVVAGRATGMLWTANNRILGGQALEKLGDGGYYRPARAAAIRDDLTELIARRAPVAPRDFLAIQLDDRSRFLERWQKRLLDTLTPEAIAGKKSRAEMRSLAESWGARASVDSPGYAVVKAFRLAVAHRVLDPIFAPCVKVDPGFSWDRLQYEDALWALIQGRPPHLLNPEFGDWDSLLVAAADDAAASLGGRSLSPATAAWGKLNTLEMRHPFSLVLPVWLTRGLNMPEDPLPGDADMPRVQSPQFGASERFAVSPGHESEGIFEMPGGQSGHPLSPYYRAGHEAWVKGEATPFLPGPAEHKLVLAP